MSAADPVDAAIAELAASDPRPNRWNLGLPACKAALYCGAAHQAEHRPAHKGSCRIVKGARATLAREEAALPRGHTTEGANPFETEVGRFWLFPELRPYMRARHGVVAASLNVRTGEAVDVALDMSLETLRLNRGDNQGVRSGVPALFARLGRDQEAYDFMRWFITDLDSTLNPELPFFPAEVRGKDIFEAPLPLLNNCIDPSFLATLTHLKIRLLFDLLVLQKYSSTKPSADYATKQAWIREDAMSEVLYHRKDIVDRPSYDDLIADMRGQVKDLHKRTTEVNKHYWPALSHPEQYSHATPVPYSMGSPEEVIGAFRDTWYMWSECPVALDFVKQLR
ncbi:hypothetical protein F4780DRAFT_794409 [Xylariomycetidae sp. FL0641]|nr:hypothetical protein F4780DRAFT_794409 [Xylariomycetidae sp. FL0641]